MYSSQADSGNKVPLASRVGPVSSSNPATPPILQSFLNCSAAGVAHLMLQPLPTSHKPSSTLPANTTTRSQLPAWNATLHGVAATAASLENKHQISPCTASSSPSTQLHKTKLHTCCSRMPITNSQCINGCLVQHVKLMLAYRDPPPIICQHNRC